MIDIAKIRALISDVNEGMISPFRYGVEAGKRIPELCDEIERLQGVEGLLRVAKGCQGHA